MENLKLNQLWNLMDLKYKAHPWHGISIGDDAPEEVQVCVEGPVFTGAQIETFHETR